MKYYFSMIVFVATMVGCSTNVTSQVSETMPYTDYREIPFTTIQGDTTRLSDFSGNVVLVVNVASRCGFTGQYEGLEELYRRFESRGFTVIGFPANNFMGQEPGSNEEILDFCRTTYDVTFPMMAKINVKGRDIHPLYRYFTNESPHSGRITWNFNKFLLDREGNVIARFGSRTQPLDEDVITAIENALGPVD